MIYRLTVEGESKEMYVVNFNVWWREKRAFSKEDYFIDAYLFVLHEFLDVYARYSHISPLEYRKNVHPLRSTV